MQTEEQAKNEAATSPSSVEEYNEIVSSNAGNEGSEELQKENDMLAAANAVDKAKMAGAIVVENEEQRKIAEALGIKTAVDKLNSLEPGELEKKIEMAQQQPEPDMTPEEEEAEMKAFVENDDNKKYAVNLASQLEEFMKNKWFTIGQLAKKTGMEPMAATQRVQMAKLFGHIQMRIGNWQDGPEKSGKPLFKVAISKEMKLRAIDEVIQYHKDQIEQFEIQKKGLA